jgi:hypothetical protein
MVFVYELKYVDKHKLVPVTETPKTRTIATVINKVTGSDVKRLYNRLKRSGNMPQMEHLKDGNYRIMYMVLPNGLKFDPFYKGGAYYRGRSVFDRDDT